MTSEPFFEIIENHYHHTLPFVVYRKPGDIIVKALLQKDRALHFVADFNESGFVMAPFNNDEKAVLIASDHSDCLITEFNAAWIGVSSPTIGLAPVNKDKSKAEKKSHRRLIKKGIKATKDDELKKVVLSRKETLNIGETSVIDVFKRLLSSYKDAFVYMWYHPEIGLWLGATPEILLSVSGKQLRTMALAGTQNFIDFAHVVWGTKEREEQQFVTDYIIANLKPYVDVINVGKIETIKAGKLLHLKTEIHATLKKELLNLKQIINSLHPTPAICGLPREKAKQFILEMEGYDREYYTGFLGELNMKSETTRNHNKRNVENSAYKIVKKTTDLFVNLRCMQIQNVLAHIYVGGGITKNSISKYEYRETVSKAETMKKVL